MVGRGMKLLIELYGIEILSILLHFGANILLIELYGIEIPFGETDWDMIANF